MPDEPEESSGSPLGRLMSRKVMGVPLPVIGVGVLGIAILAYRLFGNKGSNSNSNPGQGTQFSSTTTTTNPQTGTSTSYTASGDGYLPGMLTYGASPMPYSGGDVYVNYPAPSNTTTVPTNPNEIYNPDGSDAGAATGETYGATEVAAVQKLVGTGGYTQAIADDVKAAYNAEVAHNGQAVADNQHYSYIGPGNVQAIPRHLTAQNQITTGLPGNPVWGAPAPVEQGNNPSGNGK